MSARYAALAHAGLIGVVVTIIANQRAIGAALDEAIEGNLDQFSSLDPTSSRPLRPSSAL